MIDLYVFRHGETDWNKADKFQGHSDIDLNAQGRAQATELGAKLQKLNLKIILSSDLKRAIDTAKIALSPQTPTIQKDPRLRECDLGEAEGMHRQKIIEKWGHGIIDRWYSIAPSEMAFCFPGGESKQEHLERTLAAIRDGVKAHPGVDRFGVSTHGGTARRLVHFCEEGIKTPFTITNCALFHMQYAPENDRWFYKGQL